MNWCIIQTQNLSAQKIMEKDQELLHAMENAVDPILHLYDWQGPSITYGYFLQPEKFFSKQGLEEEGISIARRPTGGGIIFHLWDLAFSVLLPASHPKCSQNTLENYAYINNAVIDAVEEFLQMPSVATLTPEEGVIVYPGSQHFCMAKPTKYDVMIQGRKVAGAAQRKTKYGLLHQGSISLMIPDWKVVKNILLPEVSVTEAMQSCTFALLREGAELLLARQQMQELLQKHITKR